MNGSLDFKWDQSAKKAYSKKYLCLYEVYGLDFKQIEILLWILIIADDLVLNCSFEQVTRCGTQREEVILGVWIHASRSQEIHGWVPSIWSTNGPR